MEMIPEQGVHWWELVSWPDKISSNALKVAKIGFGRLTKGPMSWEKKSRPSEPFQLKIKKPVTTNKAKTMYS